MISRIVEIANPARLSYGGTQLRIDRDCEETVNIPLEDLGVLVLDHAQISLSAPLLAACAAANVAVLFCDGKHLPTGLLAPLEANSLHAKTLRAQIEVAEPTKKRLWQAIIQSKIREQASLARELCGKDGGLSGLVAFVRSGDPENVEARAARVYWNLLFGREFLRDRDLPGINSMLNYGYALVRAAVARSICSAGLHPALGVHHSNQYNPFALADDLVEPLRPLVDAAVSAYVQSEGEVEELTPPVKRALLGVLVSKVTLDGKQYPLMTALELYAANARRCLLCESRKLVCPAR